MHHKVKIELSGHGKGKVWIDDKEIEGVIGLKVEAGVSRTNEVTVIILAKEVDITSMENEVRRYARIPSAEN